MFRRDRAPTDCVTSEKGETSVTESPENKGIRVERYSHKYSSVAKIHHYHWNHKYSPTNTLPQRLVVLVGKGISKCAKNKMGKKISMFGKYTTVYNYALDVG